MMTSLLCAIVGHERLRVENEAMYRELRMKCELNEELTRHRREDAKTLAEARREVAHLNELVAQLSGHANSKQKIQRVRNAHPPVWCGDPVW